MVTIKPSKYRVVDTITAIEGDVKNIVVLCSEDLKKLDWILCGQDIDIAIVPRALTKKEEDAIRVCFTSKNAVIITNI